MERADHACGKHVTLTFAPIHAADYIGDVFVYSHPCNTNRWQLKSLLAVDLASQSSIANTHTVWQGTWQLASLCTEWISITDYGILQLTTDAFSALMLLVG